MCKLTKVKLIILLLIVILTILLHSRTINTISVCAVKCLHSTKLHILINIDVMLGDYATFANF